MPVRVFLADATKPAYTADTYLFWEIASRKVFFLRLVHEEERLARANEVPLPPFGPSSQLAPQFPHITFTQRIITRDLPITSVGVH